jgi:hypothetical protein
MQKVYMARFITIHSSSTGTNHQDVNADNIHDKNGSKIGAFSDMSGIPKIEQFGVLSPELATLWMPSQLPAGIRDRLCESGLADTELRLRLAALEGSLHHIRRQIRVRSALLRHKKMHIDGPGQKENVRSRQIISNITSKLNREVARYCRSHAAARSLDPDGNWSHQYLELRHEDLRPPTQEEDSLGVGFRELSWIWRVQTLDQRDVPTRKDGNEISEAEIHESKVVLYSFHKLF